MRLSKRLTAESGRYGSSAFRNVITEANDATVAHEQDPRDPADEVPDLSIVVGSSVKNLTGSRCAREEGGGSGPADTDKRHRTRSRVFASLRNQLLAGVTLGINKSDQSRRRPQF